MIRIGLCCIFHEEPITFRTITAKNLLKLGKTSQLEKLDELCQHNLRSLLQAMQFCYRNKIGSFRIQSGLIPLATHPEVNYHWTDLLNASILENLFQKCKDFSLKSRIRTTFHPDQFIVLSTPNESVLKNSLSELKYQAEMASLIGSDVINVHAGGVYGDKKLALYRLAKQLDTIPQEIRSRLTLENDDKNYTPSDLLAICTTHNIPLVYDVHHHRCLPDELSIKEATERALKTWNREPLFHLSSPKNGWGKPNPHHHHDYIDYTDFPDCWKNLELTVEIEAKAKELATTKLIKELEAEGIRIFQNFCLHSSQSISACY